MRHRHLPLLLAALLCALGATAGAGAQVRQAQDTAVLPVWNNASGKLEAYLVLEPSDVADARIRKRFGMSSLDATFGLEAGDSLALLCDRKNGIASAIGNRAGAPNPCAIVQTRVGANIHGHGRHDPLSGLGCR